MKPLLIRTIWHKKSGEPPLYIDITNFQSVGFEPTDSQESSDLQSEALNHSANSAKIDFANLMPNNISVILSDQQP